MTAAGAGKAVICDGSRTAAARGPVLAAGLRARIVAHLERFPMLTAYEVARALGVPAVKKELARMEADGVASRHVAPRSGGDRRPAVKWTVP